jgi:3-methyladenine DNA glycosylase AlkD
MTTQQISRDLKSLANPELASQAQRYFKTGAGEYGEGDRFLGIRVPVLRVQLKKYESATLEDARQLLASEFHEERLFAVLLLVRKFDKSNDAERAAIYWLYLNNTSQINNWDLVDSSASQIVGRYLESHDRLILYKLVESSSLWERRIAIIATFYFIKNNQFDDALKLATQLLDDEEDLIHKAVGWMLREIGKRDGEVERNFLLAFYKSMPRTMLRYAIERFPDSERKQYLLGDA